MVLHLVTHENFPFVLMGLSANFLLAQFIGPIFILPARKKAFSRENLSVHDEIHKKTFGDDAKIDGLGNPDQG